MDAEHTSAAVQRYLDELAGDSPAEPVIRALLDRAVRRLEKLCATFLYRSYPRLTRPPTNLQPDEMLGAVVERLLNRTSPQMPRISCARKLRPRARSVASGRMVSGVNVLMEVTVTPSQNQRTGPESSAVRRPDRHPWWGGLPHQGNLVRRQAVGGVHQVGHLHFELPGLRRQGVQRGDAPGVFLPQPFDFGHRERLRVTAWDFVDLAGIGCFGQDAAGQGGPTRWTNPRLAFRRASIQGRSTRPRSYLTD